MDAFRLIMKITPYSRQKKLRRKVALSEYSQTCQLNYLLFQHQKATGKNFIYCICYIFAPFSNTKNWALSFLSVCSHVINTNWLCNFWRWARVQGSEEMFGEMKIAVPIVQRFLIKYYCCKNMYKHINKRFHQISLAAVNVFHASTTIWHYLCAQNPWVLVCLVFLGG